MQQQQLEFFINKENGLWDCKVCGRNGNLHELAREMGDSLSQMAGVTNAKDAVGGGKKPAPLPDIERMHGVA